MDNENTKASSNIPLTGVHFPLGVLGLGGFTPSKAKKVASLNSFRFDKDSGKIIQHSTKRLFISIISPLSVIIEKTVVEDITKKTLATYLIGV
jgi:hypothetical protein